MPGALRRTVVGAFEAAGAVPTAEASGAGTSALRARRRPAAGATAQAWAQSVGLAAAPPSSRPRAPLFLTYRSAGDACQEAAAATRAHLEPGLPVPVHATNVVFLWSVGGLATFLGPALPLLTCTFTCREGGT